MEPEKSMGRVHHGGATLPYLNHNLNALHFNQCDNLQLSGLTHRDSPKSKHITISNLHIIAPENSPNTDGIDISVSCYVNIHDSVVGTRDDCITIINGSSYINFTNIACGQGHGIRYSVGSLGEHGAYDTAEAIHVRNCTFNGTQNGARIKTHYYNISFRWWMMVADIRKILSVISDIKWSPCTMQLEGNRFDDAMLHSGGLPEEIHALCGLNAMGLVMPCCIKPEEPEGSRQKQSKTPTKQELEVNHVDYPFASHFFKESNNKLQVWRNKVAEKKDNNQPISIICIASVHLPLKLYKGATRPPPSFGLDAVDGGATSGCCRSKRLGGYGYAKNISFKQIKLVAAKNPIIIDQHYCNSGHDCKNYTSAVSETDVSYSDFQRTSETEEAIKFDCSEPPGCINIVMDQINITSAVAGKEVHAFCINVNGTSNATVPVVHCLKK
ncbi:hypothetical protein DVH24_000267 [Malus domestica]|uniref:Polygalacturonase n=1 Tax=Malus domestica TaxID=3750 RepID=A0A498IZG6_MALDO|nr:hypothetical protein DVH24_000267 [Malus domestica]